MDACLIETHSDTTSRTTQPAQGRWLMAAFLATLSIGLIWRMARYFAGFPIWGDEAMLLLNIVERDFTGLTQCLRFAQVAPILFLWLEKSATIFWGTAEWSVHLFPFMAGTGALVLFWRTCRACLPPVTAGLAVAILAVSYYPVRHSVEVKPYAFDLLFSVVYAWLTLGHLRSPATTRWLIGLLAVTPFAVFSSYPSVFVGGAVSLTLAYSIWQGTLSQRILFVLYNVALCGTFLVHYGIVAKEQIDVEAADRTREFLREYWKDAFPPDSLVDWPLWLLKVFTGNMLAYPTGANRGGSTLTCLLVILGSVAIARTALTAPAGDATKPSAWSLLALCWLPFALNLVAAVLRKYPFGESARITLHLAPFLCILMAHGISFLTDRIRSPQWRERSLLFVYAVLLTLGCVGLARDLVKPFKTEHDREVRQFVRDLSARLATGESVLMAHSREEEPIAELAWYLTTQPWRLDWGPAQISTTTPALILLCSNDEPGLNDLKNRFPSFDRDWIITETDVRRIPPENAKMPPLYCRWARIVPKAP